MYLRHTTVKKNGKTHIYWRLVRSVRVGKKVRQETVAQLGEFDAKGRAKASALAKHFLGPRVNQRDLFEDTTKVGPLEVHIDKVRVERSRSFGDVWLAWKLWQVLGLDVFCETVFEEGRETVAWAECRAPRRSDQADRTDRDTPPSRPHRSRAAAARPSASDTMGGFAEGLAPGASGSLFALSRRSKDSYGNESKKKDTKH